MKILKPLIVAALTLPTALLPTSPAFAATHSPCVYRNATAPYVTMVGDGVAWMNASGAIGGCPSVATTKPESVTIRVAVQHFEAGVWVDKATATYTRAWNRYSRFARQAGGTLTVVCEVGDWRTDVTGGDGWTPDHWTSPVATMTTGDSGVCGSWGGAD